MKKIFAIALALVMVFSMASAFALSACDTRVYAWGCPVDNTYCGTAKVEVVPYVHVNADCNGDEFVVNSCAGAVAEENLYFAVKLTVDAYPYKAWFDAGYVEFKTAGIAGADYKYEDGKDVTFDTIDFDADEEEVYYLLNDGSWKNVEDLDEDFVVDAPLFKAAAAKNAKKVELCARIFSEYNGYDKANEVGDYTITFATTSDWGAKGEFTGTMTVANEDGDEAVYTVENGEIMTVDQDVKGLAAEIQAKLNLGCGLDICVNKDNIKANFGWKDKVESCFQWSKSAMAIVDPECVVAIPKTGDVSVVAYAVMAVVAAAGAMLKK